MKNIKSISIIGILMALSLSMIMGSTSSGQKSLADIYRTGKIRLIPEIIIDDKSLPEDVFFEDPSDICLDNKNSIYVCDVKGNNIKVLDSTGKFTKTVGRTGQGPGEFQWPFKIAIYRDWLIVWEIRNRRISILNPGGEFIKSVQIPRYEGRPRKIQALPNGDFVIEKTKTYYGDNKKPQECIIEIYSPELELKKTPYTREVWEDKYIITPESTNVPQPFAALVYWDVSPDGKIIVGFSESYTIEIYDSEKGKLSSFSHRYEPVKITEQDKKTWFAGLTSAGPDGVTQGAPDYIVKNTAFPKYKPPYQHIMADSEGNILVFPYKEGNFKELKNFDAFDYRGKFISNVQIEGEVTFPNLTRIISRENCFWFIEQDKEGLFRIVKSRISD